METYKFQGKSFQVDFSKCDGSINWEVNVTDGVSEASIAWNTKGNTKYLVTNLGNNVRWSLSTREEAIDQACRAVSDYSNKESSSPEDACKELMEFVENSY